jgi:hypothetical protein
VSAHVEFANIFEVLIHRFDERVDELQDRNLVLAIWGVSTGVIAKAQDLLNSASESWPRAMNSRVFIRHDSWSPSDKLGT